MMVYSMMIRIMVILAFSSACLAGCYKSDSGRDIYMDGDAPADVQDAGRQEPEMTEDSETCEPSGLILSPVSCEALHGPVDCERLVSDVRVLLFQGSSPILDIVLPLVGDTIIFGPVAPGTYELAAICDKEYMAYAAGIKRLRALYPDLPDCTNPNSPCASLSITLLPCATSVVPVVLSCFEFDCDDCCGF